jgi:hypothetical protein
MSGASITGNSIHGGSLGTSWQNHWALLRDSYQEGVAGRSEINGADN